MLLEEKLKINLNFNTYYNNYLEIKNKLVKNINEIKHQELENLHRIKVNQYIDGLDTSIEEIVEINNKIKLLMIQIKEEKKIQENIENIESLDDSDFEDIKKEISIYDPKEIINKIILNTN